MKITELSSRSGVPVATIKFYLRENLLAGGEKSSPTQASYDDSHLARLRLIRAFIEVGGLSVASAHQVFAVMDDESLPFGLAAGVASAASTGLTRSAVSEGDAPSRGDSDLSALVAERGWTVDPRNPGWGLAARVIDDYAGLGREDLIARLSVYADAADLVAHADLQAVVEAEGRAQMTETVVVGTVLGDSLFAGLRRLAHESVSCTLFPVSDETVAQYRVAAVDTATKKDA